MRPTTTPALLLVLVAIVCLAVGGLAIMLATGTPRLGLALAATSEGIRVDAVEDFPDRAWPGASPGLILKAIGAAPKGEESGAANPLPLIADDMTAEPDSFPNYERQQLFFERQGQLHALLTQGEVALHLYSPATNDNRVTLVSPQPTAWWNLAPGFWVQTITGVAGLLIAGWVWSLRPRQLGAFLFMLSGVGLALTTATSAIYANRELAVEPGLFRALVATNHVGVVTFGFSIVSLFLAYPLRLMRPALFWLLPVLALAYLAVDLAHAATPDLLYVIVMALMLAILIAVLAQWWATRKSPPDRAALNWVGLSVLAGAGAFTVLAAAPILLGLPAGLSQSYASGVLILIYVGIALGLRRYRLFELGDWAYRVLFFTVAALLLLGLDALLIVSLKFDTAPALGISLLAVGFIYLPAREWLWQRFTRTRKIAEHELFSSALDVAFAPTPGQSAARWRELLQRLFDPLTISDTENVEKTRASGDGLQLDLPPVAGAPALRLSYPQAGRGLFSPTDIALANQLVTLTERAEEGRNAYLRGVGEERRRLARDLHDDVGARLLTGLHTADEVTRATLQAALADIRSIVSGLAGDEAGLDRVLAELRHEAARRLEAAGILLDCPLPDEDLADIRLDYRLHKALTSATREVVSNVIRHSGATMMNVSLTLSPQSMRLTFADNGKGLSDAARAGETTGFGLRNLRQRIGDVGGNLDMVSTDGGTTITLDIPLRLDPSTPEPGMRRDAGMLDSAS